jgi:hypothetical protein
MATFDKLIQEIGSQFCIGPKACPLVQETLGLISGQPGGIGSFLNRFEAAGFAVEVFSTRDALSTSTVSAGIPAFGAILPVCRARVP